MQNPNVATWKETVPPLFGSPEWRAANGSSAEWEVFVKNGAIWAKPYHERTPETITLPFRLLPVFVDKPPKAVSGTSSYAKNDAHRVKDGWILSRDAGEWGGRVDWFSPDGTRQYQISKDQITAYAQTPDGLFAVQGLAHLGLHFGTLIKLSQAAGKWESKTILDLKDAPYALLTEPNGAFLVVTGSKLLRVRVSEKTVTPLVENTFWWGMYPNSVVAAPNGDYFIGMRGGVVRVSPTRGAYQVRWLTPTAS